MSLEAYPWLYPTKMLAKAILTDDENNILVLTRVAYGDRPECSDLPGGGVTQKDFESWFREYATNPQAERPLIRTIRREVEEETGFVPEIFAEVYFESGGESLRGEDLLFRIIVCGYRCQVKGIKPSPQLDQTEHSGFNWLSKNEALALDFGNDGGFHHNFLKAVFK